jgi:hypothetical protein
LVGRVLELSYTILLTFCVDLIIEAEREVIAVAKKANKDVKKAQGAENKQRNEAVAK